MAPSPDNKSSSSINIEHPTPEAYGGVPQMIERANSACKEHERMVDPPNKWEVGAWYHELVHRSIVVGDFHFSPLEWTSISWAVGLTLVGPILPKIARHLDHGPYHALVLGGATAVGAFFCLPTGLFKPIWFFPPYIASIVAADTIAITAHTRHLGLMVRGYASNAQPDFPARRAIMGWLSSHATAAGSLGSAIIAAFTYHMLRHDDQRTSLWVVSIFSGLKWFSGMAHAFVVGRPMGRPDPARSSLHITSIAAYPHAVGAVAGVAVSSFALSTVFTAALLYVVGELCMRPAALLCLMLVYFTVPVVSMPLMQAVQMLIKADAVRMQVMGLLMSAAVSGVGWYNRRGDWGTAHVLTLALAQGTACGLLHAYGRALVADCTPAGREGAFSAWYAFARGVGACAGFALAGARPGTCGRHSGRHLSHALWGFQCLCLGMSLQAEVEVLIEGFGRESFDITCNIILFRKFFTIENLGIAFALLLVKNLDLLAQKKTEHVQQDGLWSARDLVDSIESYIMFTVCNGQYSAHVLPRLRGGLDIRLSLILVDKHWETFCNLKTRVADFVRCWELTSILNERYPDATPQERVVDQLLCFIGMPIIA
ncbi:hypothetical protein QJS10_CPB20g01175 [Acorus calamus]|uniref:Uncharacterized protein n=1 Tax=Acorus calamus TaxID=4465 RepID=A0AAV9CAN8_ACOCL|nr:hypothetical protein QJS10_CPB20g01175 [Acorus calamus]